MKMNCIDNDFIVLVTRYRLFLASLVPCFFGSVEILIKTNNRSWVLQFFMLPPPPLGYPPIATTPDKVEIYPKKKRGARGCSP
jgi:hypothetical protein